jgi:hypothetical protein
MSKKWLLSNISVKPNPKNARERVGVPLSIRIVRNGKEETIDLYQGQSAMTESLTEGHLKFIKSNLMGVREVSDVSVLLEERTREAKKVESKTPVQSVQVAQRKLKELKAKATPMGTRTEEKDKPKSEDAFTAKPLGRSRDNTTENDYTATAESSETKRKKREEQSEK